MLYEVLSQRCPAWKVDERDSEALARRKSGLDVFDAERYPDDYTGRVISVVPKGHVWGPGDLADPVRAVVTLDLNDDELKALRARGRKVTERGLAPVTFVDRWGALAETLRTNFPGEGKAEDAERAQDDELSEPGRRFAELSALARRMFVPTVVHSGAGLYEVGPGKTYSTIQSALDQLWTDQGGALFAATQYIRVFADTYDENVAPNAGLTPSYVTGKALIIEGDSADSRDNILVQPTSGTYGIYVNCDSATVRHMKIDATGAGHAITTGGGCFSITVSDAILIAHVADRAVNVASSTVGLVRNCDIQTSGNCLAVYVLSSSCLIRGCTFKQSGAAGTSYGALVSTASSAVIESCTFSGYTYGVAPGTQWGGYVKVSNTTFYNCTSAFYTYRCLKRVDVTNCIMDSCTYVFYSTASNWGWPDEGTEGNYGSWFTLRNNCFYGYTNFAGIGVDYKTYAEFAAFDLVDAAGDLDATNPLLTDPASDDFSFTDASPCWHTGHGSGVIKDYLGNLFDPYHPNRGAWAAGILPPPPEPPPVMTSVGSLLRRQPHYVTLTRPATVRDADSNVATRDYNNPVKTATVRCLFQSRGGEVSIGDEGNIVPFDSKLYTIEEDVQVNDCIVVALSFYTGNFLVTAVVPKGKIRGGYSHNEVFLQKDGVR